jgi:hypothetical protein
MKAFLITLACLWALKIYFLCRVTPGYVCKPWTGGQIFVMLISRIALLAWALVLLTTLADN